MAGNDAIFVNYPNGSGGGGGGTINGTIAATQIAVGDGADSIAGSNDFVWDGASLILSEVVGIASADANTLEVNSGTVGTLRDVLARALYVTNDPSGLRSNGGKTWIISKGVPDGNILLGGISGPDAGMRVLASGGPIEFNTGGDGGTIAPIRANYQSSDGTAGVTAGPFTVITGITVKNGIVTALTGS